MFTHLHNHFLGSFSDSVMDIEKVAPIMKERGTTALGITDHGDISYIYFFYRTCKAYGIKPIIGCEFYYVKDASYVIKKNIPYRNHLILFAKNNNGIRNLVAIHNASWAENNYQGIRGLVDQKLLEKYHDNMIMLSACFFGSIPIKFIDNKPDEAEKEFRYFYDIFGSDLYLEVANHGLDEEEIANKGLIKLSKKYSTKIVLTNDVHYFNRNDWVAHEIVIRTRFGKLTNFSFSSKEYYMKTEDEMRSLGFPDEYLENTSEVVDKCEVCLENIFEDSFDNTKEYFEEKNKEKKSSERIIYSSYLHCDTRKETVKYIRDYFKLDNENRILLEKHHLNRIKDIEFPGFMFQNVDIDIKDIISKIGSLHRKLEPDKYNRVIIPEKNMPYIPIKFLYGYPFINLKKEEFSYFGISEVSLPVDHQEFTLEMARYCFQKKDYTSSEKILIELLKKGLNDSYIYFYLGNISYYKRDYKSSRDYFLKLVEVEPEFSYISDVYTWLGWVYNWLNKRELALEYFQRAIKSDKTNSLAYYGLGIVNYLIDNFLDAKKYLKIFLDKASEHPRAVKAREILRKISQR